MILIDLITDADRYDELVKPIHPVLDYNTRYSGITEEHLANVSITLTDVQAVMLTRFKPNTILVGHSLESDLIALKLSHDYVVDTSVLMPHKMGPPYKRALRNLSSECLGKIIQVGEHGHDRSVTEFDEYLLFLSFQCTHSAFTTYDL
jgi:RNA exonuclease 1